MPGDPPQSGAFVLPKELLVEQQNTPVEAYDREFCCCAGTAS